MDDGLLNVEEVAGYLGVGPVTIYRWCREGSLPCMKVGKAWRIRRSALEEFLERSERSATLVGKLRSFLEVPDNVLAIAQSPELMFRLDTAFFQVGEARGGALIKYYHDEPGPPSVDDLRAELKRSGLRIKRLEEEGRLRFVVEGRSPGGRPEALRQAAAEANKEGRTLWASFNWEERVDLNVALEQQREIAGRIEDTRAVIQTSVMEEALDDWPGATLRRVQNMHSGTIWLSEAGLALSRVMPPPSSTETG